MSATNKVFHAKFKMVVGGGGFCYLGFKLDGGSLWLWGLVLQRAGELRGGHHLLLNHNLNIYYLYFSRGAPIVIYGTDEVISIDR